MPETKPEPQSLAEALGLEIPEPPSEPNLVDITDSKAFARAVVESKDFRSYIVSGLRLGDLPGFTSILVRLIDHAWGKAPEKVEVTGKDGQPIETVAEVRRVVVRSVAPDVVSYETPTEAPPKYPTH